MLMIILEETGQFLLALLQNKLKEILFYKLMLTLDAALILPLLLFLLLIPFVDFLN